MEKPSGPGALSEAIDQITSIIFASKKGFINSPLFSAFTKLGTLERKSEVNSESTTPSSVNNFLK